VRSVRLPRRLENKIGNAAENRTQGAHTWSNDSTI
jgi:hypothetical protein